MSEDNSGIFQWIRNWRRLRTHQLEAPPDSKVDDQSAGPFNFAQISNIPCLILLGPPGAGKSTELARARAMEHGEYTAMVALRRISASNDLSRELAAAKIEWLQHQNRNLSIYLDGLDELPVNLEESRNWILGWIKETLSESSSGQTLKLRLTCRSADWPVSFTEDLASAFGKDAVAVFELLPLSDSDIDLVTAERPDAVRNQIRQTLAKNDLAPLARLPVTLKMLLRVFDSKSQGLPSSMQELYRDAITAMVEVRRLQDSAGSKGNQLSNLEIVSLLGRIAAVSVLANKPLIWAGLHSDGVPKSAFAISEVSGGVEGTAYHAFSADERKFRLVLGTALFRSEGPFLFAWQHQTFAEFLAAVYLSSSGRTTDQLLNLLAIDEHDGPHITPQLRELAAWLASLDEDFRSKLITMDPALLLISDVGVADDLFKSRLVSELLNRINSGELDDHWDDRRVDYGRLKFEGLSNLLEPFISDSSMRVAVRRAAMMIATECEVSSLLPIIRSVVLNSEERHPIRVAGLRALAGISDAGSIEVFKAILNLPPVEDFDDEMRGISLRKLWPKSIRDIELFGHLVVPKAPNLVGSYAMFLYRLDLQDLSVEGAVAAIKWVQSLDNTSMQRIEMGSVAVAALTGAWKQMQNDAVLDAFVALIITSIRDRTHLRTIDLTVFKTAYNSSLPENRRRLFLTLLRTYPELRSFDLAIAPWFLVNDHDIDWLLDEIETSRSTQSSAVEIELLIMLLRNGDLNTADRAWDISSNVKSLREALERLYSVDINSDQANWQKEQHDERSHKPERTDPMELVDRLVDECENDISAWWRLNLQMLMDSGEQDRPNELEADLRASRAWRLAEADKRDRIKRLAHRYLIEESPPNNVDWIGKNTIWRPIAAAYRALRLLADEDPAALAALPTSTWEKWGTAAVWFVSNESQEDIATRAGIVGNAWLRAKSQVFDAIRKLLSKENANFNTPDILAKVVDLDLYDAMWGAVKNGSLEKYASTKFIEYLFLREYQPALTEAECLMLGGGSAIESSLKSRDVQLAASGLLVLLDPSRHWPSLYALRASSDTLAREILLWIADRSSRGTELTGRLAPRQLKELYKWISEDFRRSEAPSSGWVTPEHQLDFTASDILNRLTNDGSADAVTALRELRSEIPEQEYLQWYLNNAKERHREHVWRWRSPKELLFLLGVIVEEDPSFEKSLIAKIGIEQSGYGQFGRDGTPTPGSVYEASSGESITVEIEKKTRFCFLFVATEWGSQYGGISAFNRDLCRSLAKRHAVYCLVPSVDAKSSASASADAVTIITATKMVDYEGEDLLGAVISVDISEKPDFIVGHDHITGRQALRIRDCFFTNAKYVHFVHTIPSESEAFKPTGDITTRLEKGDEKSRRQRILIDESDLAVGVGPRIFEAINNQTEPLKYFKFIPGFNEDYLSKKRHHDGSQRLSILWLGRGEDADLKGLHVALEITKDLMGKSPDGVRDAKLIVRGATFSQRNAAMNACTESEIPSTYIEVRAYSVDPADIHRDIVQAAIMIMPSMVEAFGLVGLGGDRLRDAGDSKLRQRCRTLTERAYFDV